MLPAALDPHFKNLKFLTNDLIQLVREELSQLKDADCGNPNFQSIAVKEKELSTPPRKKKQTALDLLLGLGGDNYSDASGSDTELTDFCLRNRTSYFRCTGVVEYE